jgi:DNA-3-methyladenine glycosylase II
MSNLYDLQAIKAGTKLLKSADESMAEVIGKRGAYAPLSKSGTHFESLFNAILSQQISVSAADTIRRRVVAAVDGKVQPSTLASLHEDDLRACGVSRQKAGYILDLATHFMADPKFFQSLGRHPDEEVITRLTEIRGLGRWSAQMFLIFRLGRPDVFAPDDMGLRIAMARHYGVEQKAPKRDLEAIAEAWAPWRSLACLYLWRSLDNKPGG